MNCADRNKTDYYDNQPVFYSLPKWCLILVPTLSKFLTKASYLNPTWGNQHIVTCQSSASQFLLPILPHSVTLLFHTLHYSRTLNIFCSTATFNELCTWMNYTQKMFQDTKILYQIWDTKNMQMQRNAKPNLAPVLVQYKVQFWLLIFFINYRTTECHTPEHSHCHDNIKIQSCVT